MISSWNREATRSASAPGAVDGDLVAPHGDVDVGEGVLDLAEQLIALAEETGHEVVAGNEDLYRGACHVRSACDPTSGPGGSGRIVDRRPWSSSVVPTGCPGQPGGQSNGPAAQHVEVEVGHAVGGVGTHVEGETVAPVLASDPLGVGHRLGRHQEGHDVVGVLGHDGGGVHDVAGRHHQHVDGRLGVDVPERHRALVAVDDVGRHVAGDDGAEEAVGHGAHPRACTQGSFSPRRRQAPRPRRGPPGSAPSPRGRGVRGCPARSGSTR